MGDPHLSNEINKIVQSYVDLEGYLTYTFPNNHLCRVDILKDELSDISNEDLLRYNLSHKLAKMWINEYKVERCDVTTVANIMGLQLNYYTYEEIVEMIKKHPYVEENEDDYGVFHQMPRMPQFYDTIVMRVYDVMCNSILNDYTPINSQSGPIKILSELNTNVSNFFHRKQRKSGYKKYVR
jgi:hypothetical protein